MPLVDTFPDAVSTELLAFFNENTHTISMDKWGKSVYLIVF